MEVSCLETHTLRHVNRSAALYLVDVLCGLRVFFPPLPSNRAKRHENEGVARQSLMSLFLMLLPTYLLGNFHCMGMCGPLVMMLGQHRHRAFYFVGRTASFALAGGLAGGLGAVVNVIFARTHLSAATSLFFGLVIALAGVLTIMGRSIPLPKSVQSVNRTMSLLLLRDEKLPTFLFGFATVLLPCGQTLIVFSACALSESLWVGLANGALFALFTSPSLFFAMQAKHLFHQFKSSANTLIGVSALLVGGLACLRGLADLGWITHLVLNEQYHIALY